METRFVGRHQRRSPPHLEGRQFGNGGGDGDGGDVGPLGGVTLPSPAQSSAAPLGGAGSAVAPSSSPVNPPAVTSSTPAVDGPQLPSRITSISAPSAAATSNPAASSASAPPSSSDNPAPSSPPPSSVAGQSSTASAVSTVSSAPSSSAPPPVSSTSSVAAPPSSTPLSSSTLVPSPSSSTSDIIAAPAVSSTASPAQDSRSHSHTGAIVGGVLGAIIGVAIVWILAMCLLRRRRQREVAKELEDSLRLHWVPPVGRPASRLFNNLRRGSTGPRPPPKDLASEPHEKDLGGQDGYRAANLAGFGAHGPATYKELEAVANVLPSPSLPPASDAGSYFPYTPAGSSGPGAHGAPGVAATPPSNIQAGRMPIQVQRSSPTRFPSSVNRVRSPLAGPGDSFS